MTGIATQTLVLVLGRPAAGKSTVARRISDRFDLPLLAKDDVKEILLDRLGTGDRTWSRRLGQASFALLDHAIDQQLRSGTSFVVDAAYDARFEESRFRALQRRYGFIGLQVLCLARPETLLERFATRATSGLRHAGHGDADGLEEFRASLQDGRALTFALEGTVLELDTEAPGSTEVLLTQLEQAGLGRREP